jgi:hypothetical protein
MINFPQNILGFIMAAEKSLLLEVSAGRHADTGLPYLFQGPPGLQLRIGVVGKTHVVTIGSEFFVKGLVSYNSS